MSYADTIFHSVALTAVEFKSDEAVTKLYVDAKVAEARDVLLNGVGPAYDTLKELADGLTVGGSAAADLLAAVGALRTDLTTEIADREGYLSHEVDMRMSVDQDLGSRLDAAHTNLVLTQGVLQGQIYTANTTATAEHDNRVYAEAVLSDRVGYVDARLSTAIVSLQTKLPTSSQYEKRDDGNLQVVYLYITDVWRLGASTAVGSKRLQFEYFDGTTWSVAVPFIRAA